VLQLHLFEAGLVEILFNLPLLLRLLFVDFHS
jgi:hypothetical protein